MSLSEVPLPVGFWTYILYTICRRCGLLLIIIHISVSPLGRDGGSTDKVLSPTVGKIKKVKI